MSDSQSTREAVREQTCHIREPLPSPRRNPSWQTCRFFRHAQALEVHRQALAHRMWYAPLSVSRHGEVGAVQKSAQLFFRHRFQSQPEPEHRRLPVQTVHAGLHHIAPLRAPPTFTQRLARASMCPSVLQPAGARAQHALQLNLITLVHVSACAGCTLGTDAHGIRTLFHHPALVHHLYESLP